MNVAISRIELHQRKILPHKGFHCAHRVYHRGDSCSQVVKQIILDQGLFRGIADIRKQFRERCRAAQAIRISQADGADGEIDHPVENNPSKPNRSKNCGIADVPVIPCACAIGAGDGCEALPCLAF